MKHPLEVVNVSIVLKKTKCFLDKNGRYPVKLQLSFMRKQKFYNIKGGRCTPEEFEAIINPKSKGDKKVIREKFNAVKMRAEDIINELEKFSFEEFEAEFIGTKARKASIQEYFELKALELDADNKFRTAASYRATIKSLEKYDSKISFSRISPKYLKTYEKWMVGEKEKSYTTVGVYMRNLKHIINRAIADKRLKSYPFGTAKDKYQIPKSNNFKKALTLEDIEKLYNYEPEDRNEFLAQQYWLFSYMCSGMNMVDVANLKYKNIQDNHIKFIRQKTKDTTSQKTEIVVLLNEAIWDIINRIGTKQKEPENYIFPILTKEMTTFERYKRVNQHIKNTNKYLKRLAGKVGIDESITTYWARHSFSTILKRTGAPLAYISDQLGHKNLKTTQNYLDSFEDEQRKKYSASLLGFKKKDN